MTGSDTTALRIAIVTSGSLGSNPRVVKEAQALHDAGHVVTVISTRVAAFVEPRDRSIIDKAPYSIIRISFGDRVGRGIDRLSSEAARAVFMMTSHPLAAAVGLSLMTRRLTRAAKNVPADLYIAHYVAALPAAAKAAKVHGARYAFDAEDFHLGDLPDLSQHDFERSLIRTIEGKWLPGAAYVSAAAPLIADAYAETYGIERPTVILNVFPRSSGPGEPTPKGTAVPGPSLYWFSQTIGAGRGLETALEAISIAKSKPHLHLRGTPAEGYREKLIKLAASFGVADRLHFHDPVTPNELELAGAAFDLGFVGETGETRNRNIALTNKLFSYLTSGLPVIASSIPAHSEIAGSFGKAMSLFDPGDSYGLARQLDGLLDNPASLAAAREQSWRLGQTSFCWEEEEMKLIKGASGATAYDI